MTPPSFSTARQIPLVRVVIQSVGVMSCLFLILALLVPPQNPAFVDVPYRLLAGWSLHGMKFFPIVLENWRSLLLPLGCMLLATGLIHRFALWWRSAKAFPGEWNFKQTLRGALLLLLGAAAAIALSGVVHQMVWLSQGQWTQTNHRTELTEAVSKMRQLSLLVSEFQEENGRYPYSLGELQTPQDTNDFIERMTWIEPQRGGVRERFILLHPGRVTQLSSDEPLIVSPWIVREDKIVVGYVDLSVRSQPAENFKGILQSREAVVKSPESHE